MSFLDEAKSILDAEDVEALMFLTGKAGNFETSAEEDADLARLKAKVHTSITDRLRVEQLGFLRNKTFTASEVLLAAGYTRKEIIDAVSLVYPREAPEAGVVIAVYPEGSLFENQRVSKILKQAIKDGGVATFVAVMTEAGRSHLSISKLVAKGPAVGKVAFANLTAFAKRTGLEYDDLKTALAL